MTKEQAELLVFIKRFIDKNGYSPSYEEISSGLGYSSKSRVHARVTALVKLGKITKVEHMSRSIEVAK